MIVQNCQIVKHSMHAATNITYTELMSFSLNMWAEMTFSVSKVVMVLVMIRNG